MTAVIAGFAAFSTDASATICSSVAPTEKCKNEPWSKTPGCYMVWGTLSLMCQGAFGKATEYPTLSDEMSRKVLADCKSGSDSKCNATLEESIKDQVKAYEQGLAKTEEGTYVSKIVDQIKASPQYNNQTGQ